MLYLSLAYTYIYTFAHYIVTHICHLPDRLELLARVLVVVLLLPPPLDHQEGVD